MQPKKGTALWDAMRIRDPIIRKQAMANVLAQESTWFEWSGSEECAIDFQFDWHETPEGEDYWSKIHEDKAGYSGFWEDQPIWDVLPADYWIIAPDYETDDTDKFARQYNNLYEENIGGSCKYYRIKDGTSAGDYVENVENDSDSEYHSLPQIPYEQWTDLVKVVEKPVEKPIDCSRDALRGMSAAIHCPTEQEWALVTRVLGHEWSKTTSWKDYKDKSCINAHWQGYADLGHYTKDKYTIITAADFLAANPAPFKDGDYVVITKTEGGDPEGTITRIVEMYQNDSGDANLANVTKTHLSNIPTWGATNGCFRHATQADIGAALAVPAMIEPVPEFMQWHVGDLLAEAWLKKQTAYHGVKGKVHGVLLHVMGDRKVEEVKEGWAKVSGTGDLWIEPQKYNRDIIEKPEVPTAPAVPAIDCSLSAIIGKDIAIHCVTAEEWDTVTRILKHAWGKYSKWDTYKKETCINSGEVGYADVAYYRRNNYVIVPACDFIATNTTTISVPKAEPTWKVGDKLPMHWLKKQDLNFKLGGDQFNHEWARTHDRVVSEVLTNGNAAISDSSLELKPKHKCKGHYDELWNVEVITVPTVTSTAGVSATATIPQAEEKIPYKDGDWVVILDTKDIRYFSAGIDIIGTVFQIPTGHAERLKDGVPSGFPGYICNYGYNDIRMAKGSEIPAKGLKKGDWVYIERSCESSTNEAGDVRQIIETMRGSIGDSQNIPICKLDSKKAYGQWEREWDLRIATLEELPGLDCKVGDWVVVMPEYAVGLSTNIKAGVAYQVEEQEDGCVRKLSGLFALVDKKRLRKATEAEIDAVNPAANVKNIKPGEWAYLMKHRADSNYLAKSKVGSVSKVKKVKVGLANGSGIETEVGRWYYEDCRFATPEEIAAVMPKPAFKKGDWVYILNDGCCNNGVKQDTVVQLLSDDKGKHGDWSFECTGGGLDSPVDIHDRLRHATPEEIEKAMCILPVDAPTLVEPVYKLGDIVVITKNYSGDPVGTVTEIIKDEPRSGESWVKNVAQAGTMTDVTKWWTYNDGIRHATEEEKATYRNDPTKYTAGDVVVITEYQGGDAVGTVTEILRTSSTDVTVKAVEYKGHGGGIDVWSATTPCIRKATAVEMMDYISKPAEIGAKIEAKKPMKPATPVYGVGAWIYVESVKHSSGDIGFIGEIKQIDDQTSMKAVDSFGESQWVDHRDIRYATDKELEKHLAAAEGMSKWQVGTKVKIINAGPGAMGCDGMYGFISDIVLTKNSTYSGLLYSERGINIQVEGGRIWRVNPNASLELDNRQKLSFKSEEGLDIYHDEELVWVFFGNPDKKWKISMNHSKTEYWKCGVAETHKKQIERPNDTKLFRTMEAAEAWVEKENKKLIHPIGWSFGDLLCHRDEVKRTGCYWKMDEGGHMGVTTWRFPQNDAGNNYTIEAVNEKVRDGLWLQYKPEGLPEGVGFTSYPYNAEVMITRTADGGLIGSIDPVGPIGSIAPKITLPRNWEIGDKFTCPGDDEIYWLDHVTSEGKILVLWEGEWAGSRYNPEEIDEIWGKEWTPMVKRESKGLYEQLKETGNVAIYSTKKFSWPPMEPVMVTMENAYVGMKVVRGRDWDSLNTKRALDTQDSHGTAVGTIRSTEYHLPKNVIVDWDNGNTDIRYRAGAEGCYDLYIYEEKGNQLTNNLTNQTKTQDNGKSNFNNGKDSSSISIGNSIMRKLRKYPKVTCGQGYSTGQANPAACKIKPQVTEGYHREYSRC